MDVIRKIFSELAWVAFVVGRRIKNRTLFLKRLLVAPRLPNNPDGKVLIHLGCGDIASPEFINVDARPAPHVHYICDVTDLSIFADDYADLIYVCHVLEHVRHTTLGQTLWEWRRVLKPGGILRLSVPDFDKLLCIYEASRRDLRSIISPLMGGQEHGYNIHYSAFNREYLSGKLIEAGFPEIREWNADLVSNHDFTDWANSSILRDGTAFSVSLNLEAVK